VSEINFVVSRGGATKFIYTDELAGLVENSEAQIKRASHVEPVNAAKRVAFRIIRSLVSDKSRVAAWTRKWQGPWQADMALSGGPILMGPEGKGFETRQAAIAAEVGWIHRNLFGVVATEGGGHDMQAD
jgi:hypothetical protein